MGPKAYPLASSSSKYGPSRLDRFTGQIRQIAAKPWPCRGISGRGSRTTSWAPGANGISLWVRINEIWYERPYGAAGGPGGGVLGGGLSVRDIEDALRDEAGRLLLSRTALSELGGRLWADYQEFIERDLSEHEIAYLFVDGIAGRSGRRTSWSAYSSRSAGASRSSPTASARSRPSSSCSAP